jgi:sarcosine oxidase subunit beta
VVCAAGVSSAEIAEGVGIHLPVEGEARSIHYAGGHGGVPANAPLTVDFSSGFYFHRMGPGLLFGGRQRDLDELSVPSVKRFPAMAEVPIESSWWGYYDMSPDRNAIVGAAALPGFFYATGFSGHGFQQSPAIGEHVAELIMGKSPTIDLSGFSADRFGLGVERVEKLVI